MDNKIKNSRFSLKAGYFLYKMGYNSRRCVWQFKFGNHG